MKNVVVWHLALCGSYESRYFGGKFSLNLQDIKIREGRNILPDTSRLSHQDQLTPFYAREFVSLADFSTLKMGAISSSEMSVFIRTAQRHIPAHNITRS
jgi:hypothetical protein